MNSWAQNFEDVILWRALSTIQNGTYVDIGAYDPNIDSVTKHFYDAGWSGINIEPVTENYLKFQDDRKRDVNLNCLIGKENSIREFYEIKGTGLSTVLMDIAAKHATLGFNYEITQKSSNTLSEIFDKFLPNSEVHFLKIDVEGAEEEVISSLDWNRYQPWIVVIESTQPLSQISTSEQWESVLLNANYNFVYSDGLNKFYLSSKRKELEKFFQYPPGVFDDFILVNGQFGTRTNSYDYKEQELALEISSLKNEIENIKRSRSWILASNLQKIYALKGSRLRNSSLLMRDLRKFLGQKKYERWAKLRLEDLVEHDNFELGYLGNLESNSDWQSEVISQRRFTERNFFIWMNLLREQPKLHSKQFQNYAILEAANSVVLNSENKRSAIGFGVGIEPIPTALAKIGYDVIATDYLDGNIASDWKNTDQLINTPEDLNSRGILTPEEFKRSVKFMNLDMNRIPDEFNENFDFVWSSCALGHIGGYQNGLDFIKNSTRLLKPGGIALHSTELDVSPGTEKFESPNLSLYREEDIERLFMEIKDLGFNVAKLDTKRSWTKPAEAFIDREPWGDRPHLRIEVFGREVLSLIIKISRPKI